jgi:amphi-Trp domain-containing protein
MFEKQSLEFVSAMKADSAASYLEALARGLRAGHISIQSGGEFVSLDLAPDVTVEVEAHSTAKGRASLDIALSWRLARAAEKEQELTISSERAAAPEEPTLAYSETSSE